jgi:hypothetical protein
VVLLELQALQVIWVQQARRVLLDHRARKVHMVPQGHRAQAAFLEHQEDMFRLYQLTAKVRRETNQAMLL